ncbi:MAG: hypothetical protein ACRDGW_07200 [Actinomycetota bacterium]
MGRSVTMRGSIAAAVLVLAAVVASLVAVVALARPVPQAVEPPVGPVIPADTGAGELLLVVLGGVYPTRAEAHDASAQMAFGDVQGYYVVPVAQFQGFREQIGEAREFALVSAFRTQAGADAFVELARNYGHPATILPERVRSLGGIYAGLGQEEDPDGSGPLLEPVPESLP